MNNPVKIPKGLSEIIINHSDYNCLTLFLELKPLFISGVIFNDFGKYPYQIIADRLQMSNKAVRYKLKRLQAIKLIHFDNKKNLCLHSYKVFYEYVTGKPYEYKNRIKCKYYQNKGIDEILRISTIQDNYNRQNFILKRKYILKSLGRSFKSDIIISKYADRKEKKTVSNENPLCSTGINRTIKKIVLKNSEKQNEIYFNEWKTDQLNKPEKQSDFCPCNIISFVKIGKMFGVTKEGAYYWFKKLENLNLIEQENNHVKDYTEALQYAEKFLGLQGVFKNGYRFKDPKNHFKSILNLCSTKNLNFNEIYV